MPLLLDINYIAYPSVFYLFGDVADTKPSVNEQAPLATFKQVVPPNGNIH